MKWKYEKNFTDKGYIMNYEKIPETKAGDLVYQFRIELCGIRPSIWRRVQVPQNYNFWDLHVALNDAMGWLDYHMHYFEIKPKYKREIWHVGIPDFNMTEGLKEVFPGWEIAMIAGFNEIGMEARYYYDYGDDWVHKVKFEGILVKEEKVRYPVCIDGERACPPEDSGGPQHYNEYLKVIKDPSHPEYSQFKQRYDKHDPTSFNKNKIKFDDPYKRWRNAFLEESVN